MSLKTIKKNQMVLLVRGSHWQGNKDRSEGQEGHAPCGAEGPYCHGRRQPAYPVPVSSLGSTEAGGSHDEGAVSPQTTMMPRAYREDRHQPQDPCQLHRRAGNSPGAPVCPASAFLTLNLCLAALLTPSAPTRPSPRGQSVPSLPHGDLAPA